MKFVFASRANRDLRSITFYVARDNPYKAQTFVADLRESAIDIARNPLAYPLVNVFGRRGVRRKVFQNYLIFYRVQRDTVVIVRILHGARDYPAIIKRDPDA